MNEITITLPFPPSANTAYPTNKRGGRHLSKEGTVWKAEARWVIDKMFRDRDIPIPFELEITYFWPDLRQRDVANYDKLPIDAICKQLAINDDWTVIPRVDSKSGGVDRDNPRCVVVIRAAPGVAHATLRYVSSNGNGLVLGEAHNAV